MGPPRRGASSGDAEQPGDEGRLYQKRDAPAGDTVGAVRTWAMGLLAVALVAALWHRSAQEKKAGAVVAARDAKAAYEARRARDAMLAAEEKAAGDSGDGRVTTPEMRAKAAVAMRQRLKQQLARTNASRTPANF